MKKYILKHPFLLFFVIFFGLISQGMVIYVSLFIMHIVDTIIAGDMTSLVQLIGFGLVIIGVKLLSSILASYLNNLYEYKTVLYMKTDVFSLIYKSDIYSFLKDNSGKYISIVNNDITLIYNNYITSLIQGTKIIFAVVVSLGVLFFISPFNALLSILFAIIPITLPLVFAKKLSSTNLEHMEKLEILNTKLKDYLGGFEVIKKFKAENGVVDRFLGHVEQTAKARLKLANVNAVITIYSLAVAPITRIITIFVAGYFAITGHITIGAIMAIVSLDGTVQHPINAISMVTGFIKSTTDVRKKILDLSQLNNRDSQRKTNLGSTDSIVFDNVSFSYEERTATTKNNAVASPSSKVNLKSGTAFKVSSVEEMKAIMAAHGTSEEEIATFFNMTPQMPTGVMQDNGENSNTPLPISMMPIGLPIQTQLPILEHFSKGTINNFTFTFEKGKKYALLGESGSGKSTILKLIMGYYDNYEGHLLIGDSQVRDINRDSLYDQLMLMEQNVFILDDTLENNVTLYKEFSKENYDKALALAQVDFYKEDDSFLGENGNKLSGGQRQRVALARIFMDMPRVLLFDEATSSVDSVISEKIEHTILDQNATVILVSHKYTKEMLGKFDTIIVMKNGTIVESGSFEALYKPGSFLYSLQNF
ncbi:MAG: ABC transporter ATP-binding protein/permease [Defluviitaleaceae bacterium]|nr:ABC transporter ATP-binding protein/permease [Defluviitaleaceae bacterium]